MRTGFEIGCAGTKHWSEARTKVHGLFDTATPAVIVYIHPGRGPWHGRRLP